MKIVKRPNGKYALRTGFFLFGYSYADKKTLIKDQELIWWCDDKNIDEMICFDYKEDLEFFVINNKIKRHGTIH